MKKLWSETWPFAVFLCYLTFNVALSRQEYRAMAVLINGVFLILMCSIGIISLQMREKQIRQYEDKMRELDDILVRTKWERDVARKVEWVNDEGADGDDRGDSGAGGGG